MTDIGQEHILAENEDNQRQSPKQQSPQFQADPHSAYGNSMQQKKGSIGMSSNGNNQSKKNMSIQKVANQDTNSQEGTATIDIYDNNISFKDMKHIKHQVENDVKLLRNRVRMLQMEHERAQKKINETQSKAETLERLKHENNQKYMRQMKEQEVKEAQRNQAKNGETFADMRAKQAKKIQDAKKQLMQAKANEADMVKLTLDENRQKKMRDLQEDHMEKRIKTENIKYAQQKGSKQIQSYQDRKRNQLKDEARERTEQEKRLIYKYESEAQQLEKLEEQLILELQETQEEERDAFKELEDAMLSASLSKRDRLGNGMSVSVGGDKLSAYSELPGLKQGRTGSFAPRTAGVGGTMGMTGGNFGPKAHGAMRSTQRTGNSFNTNNQFRQSFQNPSLDRQGDKMVKTIYQ